MRRHRVFQGRSRRPVPVGESPFARGVRRVQFLAAQLAPGTAERTALKLVGIIKRTLSQPGSGRIYGKHQASAPGEPPAVDLGDLRRSIGREFVGGKWRVGTGLKRAAALEFGHRYATGRVLLPRPYMRPSAEKLNREIGGEIVTDLKARGRLIVSLMD